jgi:hypothetical protein
VWFEVFARDGRPLFGTVFNERERREPKHEVRVGPPIKRRLLVVDVETFDPLPGAVVHASRRPGCQVAVATTGKEGRVVVETPERIGLSVTARGYSPGGFVQPGEVQGRTPPADVDLVAQLGRGESATGRILMPDGTPADGLPLLVQSNRTVYLSPRSTSHGGGYIRKLRTAADGTFEIPSASMGRVHLVLTDTHMAALPAEWRPELFPRQAWRRGSHCSLCRDARVACGAGRRQQVRCSSIRWHEADRDVRERVDRRSRSDRR